MQLKSVTETIHHDLRVKIIVGELPPGSKLKEEELSAFFGISRAPLREAFRMLESEHLVIYYPRRGCYVTDISLKRCKEIYQVRTMMECFAVDLIKEKGIKDLIAMESVLKEALNMEMPSSDDAYEKYDYLKAIANFHMALIKVADNSQLTYFYKSIFPNLARYQSLYTYISNLMHKSHEEHEKFIRMLKNKSYEEAKKYLSKHINQFVKLIAEKIPNDENKEEKELPN